MVLINMIVIFLIISLILYLLLWHELDDNEVNELYGEAFYQDDIFD